MSDSRDQDHADAAGSAPAPAPSTAAVLPEDEPRQPPPAGSVAGSPPVRTRRRGALAVFAVLLALVALAVVSLDWLGVLPQSQARSARLMALQRQLDDLQQQQRDSRRRFEQQVVPVVADLAVLTERTSALTPRIDDLDAAVSRLRRHDDAVTARLADLEQGQAQVGALRKQLEEQLARNDIGMADPSLVEVEYLARTARYQLEQFADFPAVLRNLREAQRLLADSRISAAPSLLQRVAAAIAQVEQAATEHSNGDDVEQMMTAAVALLPLLQAAEPARLDRGISTESAADAATWWSRLSRLLGEQIRYRRVDDDVGPRWLLGDAEHMIVLQRMELGLALARYAAHREDAEGYRNELARVDALLVRHFAADATATLQMQALLKRLAGHPVTRSVPQLAPLIEAIVDQRTRLGV